MLATLLLVVFSGSLTESALIADGRFHQKRGPPARFDEFVIFGRLCSV